MYTFGDGGSAGVTDLLLEAVIMGVTLCSSNSLCSSLSLACFALGPCFIGDANRLPRVTLGFESLTRVSIRKMS